MMNRDEAETLVQNLIDVVWFHKVLQGEPCHIQKHADKLIAALTTTPKKDPLGCNDCGLPYGSSAWIEALVPCDVWAKITPAPKENPMGGILCISCIAKRCRELGLQDVSVWMVGTEVLRARSGEPTKEEFIGHWQKMEG